MLRELQERIAVLREWTEAEVEQESSFETEWRALRDAQETCFQANEEQLLCHLEQWKIHCVQKWKEDMERLVIREEDQRQLVEMGEHAAHGILLVELQAALQHATITVNHKTEAQSLANYISMDDQGRTQMTQLTITIWAGQMDSQEQVARLAILTEEMDCRLYLQCNHQSLAAILEEIDSLYTSEHIGRQVIGAIYESTTSGIMELGALLRQEMQGRSGIKDEESQFYKNIISFHHQWQDMQQIITVHQQGTTLAAVSNHDKVAQPASYKLLIEEVIKQEQQHRKELVSSAQDHHLYHIRLLQCVTLEYTSRVNILFDEADQWLAILCVE